eukprot:g2136.t1
MSDVVKAGVLEVTVVQAVGIDLLGTTSALSRTRRKPALVARVTVDGTTKSGQPAQRSHHPVWFPAQSPSNPGDNVKTVASRPSSSSNAREGGVDNGSSGDGGGGSGGGAPNSIRSNSSVCVGMDSGGGALDRTRDRYGGGGAQDAGASGSARARGAGSALDHGDAGRSNSNSNSGTNGSSAGGLLFEVREFYGPTRILVELVSGCSGPGGGGGGGGMGGASAGGTVFGACEARLAEALVGRRGGSGSLSSSSSSKLQRASNFGLGKAARTAYGPPPVAIFSSAGETHQSPPAPRVGASNGDEDGDVDRDGDAPSLPRLAPSHTLAGPDAGQEAERDRNGDQDQLRSPASHTSDTPAAAAGAAVEAAAAAEAEAEAETGVLAAAAAVAAADSTAAAAASVAPAPFPAPTPTAQCGGCLPGGGIFRGWRRGARRQGLANATGSGDGGGDGGGSSRKAAERGGVWTGKKSRLRGGDTPLSAKKASSGPSAGGMTNVRSVAAKAAAAAAAAAGAVGSSKAIAFTLEEAEALATSDWGRGSGNGGAARDIWKPLVHVGGGGNGGKGKAKGNGGGGGGIGGGGPGPAGPAVRLRLRFIPLWDCLSDGGGMNGLGALHAAARDGDARLVTSLVRLWQSLSPGVQALSLPCRRGLTPIQHCIEAGKESALRELLRGVAKDSLRGGGGGGGSGEEGGDTPLHTAVKAGEEGMLRMLLAQTRSARVEMNPSRMFTAIRFGLGNSPNTSVDALGSDGLTPLALSAICGNEGMVKCLLDEGANAASADARGMTPIAHAAHGGHLLAVRALLKAKATGGTGSGVPGLRRSKLARLGCAPCKTNEDGMGPVALAASSGSAEVVSELLRSGIPYRTRDRDGRTPLHLAAQSGHVPVLRVLVAEMRKDREKEKGGGGREAGAAGGGGGGYAGGGGSGNAEDVVLPGGDNTWMMDGGPFRLAQRSGSGSFGGSVVESGASGRPSPVSSISGGLGSAAGSVLESCNSYEYVESDQE